MQKIGSNIKTQGKTRRSRLFRFLLIFCFSCIPIHLPDPAFSQSPDITFQKPDTLLQKLDSHYYYPSQLGLKKLRARVKWLEKDLASSQLNFISHPEVLFFWSVESGMRQFQVDPRFKDLTDDRKEEIKNFFLNYREVILPRKLNQTLSGFNFKGTQKFSSQTIAEYESPRSNDDNQKYFLNIDQKHWRISKFNIERKAPPYQVVSHFKYIQKEGRWLVSETLARFDLGRDSYLETTSYTYRKIDGFWLPKKISQTLKKGADLVRSYRFLLSDYHIN